MNKVSPWIIAHADILPPRCCVLDLACGQGRHSRFLLDRGHAVTALDRDLGAVADLATHPRVTLVAADIETGAPFALAGQHFGAVIVTNYLFRPLLPVLPLLLAPGGVLLYETFMVGQERYGRPSNPDFLLKPQELLRLCVGALQVRHYQESEEGACFQRICAIRDGSF